MITISRYNLYSRDDGMFLVMDDVEDVLIGVCGSAAIAKDIVYALNKLEDDAVEFTNLH